jgi:putative membrane protein
MQSDRTLSSDPKSSHPAGSFRTGLAAELALFRKPKVIVAALAIIFVPSLYVLIYVSSVWDPYGNLRQLPAALVNQDVPVTHAGREINLGGEIVATLEKQRPFAFIRFDTPEAARSAVRTGEVFFALLVPAEFSRQAMGSGEPAQLGLYVSEGGNYTASILSRRFGSDLAEAINEKMGGERWAALVGEAQGTDEPSLRGALQALQKGGRQLVEGAGRIHAGSLRLRDGLGSAQEGAGRLAEGSGQIAGGAARLTDGLKQVAAAVASIRSKLPEDRKLTELAQGSHALAQGATELKQGLNQLGEGVRQLDAGAGELQHRAGKVPFFGGKLSAGAGRLRAGIGTLGEGIARTSSGATQLSDGVNQLDPAIQPLTAGIIQLNAGLATLGDQLPPVEQLDLFARSMGQLRDGSASLSAGLDELKTGAGELGRGSAELESGASRLAESLDEAATGFESGLGGAGAAKLAAPAEVRVETTAPVPNNGQAFAPYFSALSLWVGALMMSFVFHLRRLPDSMQAAPRPVKWFAKTSTLFVLGALQATVVVGLVGGALGIHFAHPWLVWLAAVLGSLAFVSAVMLFMSILGDAGRLLAVVLLILQLAASGGIYPVELSPVFYQKVHGYLPFTFLVRSFRATMFSAFEGRWGLAAGGLLIFTVAAMLLTILLARWKYVPRESYGPAVEF